MRGRSLNNKMTVDMKNFTLLSFFILFAGFAHAQQWLGEGSLGYVYASPQGGMGTIIRQGHGANFSVYGVTPGRRWGFGVDVNIVSYGTQDEMKQFTFDDGTTADMEVRVNNYFTHVMLAAKYYPITTSIAQPYLVAKAGYSPFATRLSIFDPEDDDHCAPVETEILKRDGSIVGALGAGVQFDLSTFFKKWQSGKYFLEGTANYIYGGRVQYMNVDARHMNAAPVNPGRDVHAQFVDTRTQLVHEHHVGYIYQDRIEMFDVRLQLTMRFN